MPGQHGPAQLAGLLGNDRTVGSGSLFTTGSCTPNDSTVILLGSWKTAEKLGHLQLMCVCGCSTVGTGEGRRGVSDHGASSPKIMPLSPDSPAWMLPREAVRPGKPTLHGGGGVGCPNLHPRPSYILAHHIHLPTQQRASHPRQGRFVVSRAGDQRSISGSSGGCAQCVGVVGLTRIIRLHEEGDGRTKLI
jgi:hypothetical protein